MSECNLVQEQLGERVGKKRATVNNYLRLLKLPPDIQNAVKENKISMGHARALVSVENVDDQLSVFKKIIEQELSVRATEAIVRSLSEKTETTKEAKSSGDPEISRLQGRLSSHFGTKVSVAGDSKKGEIKIPYVSLEDLNRILEILDF